MSSTTNTGRSWRLDLPWTAPPLSLNPRQHGHWSKKARVVRTVRVTARILATSAKIPPCGRIAVELHYVPRDRRDRDALNLVATLKPVEDGLVDAGVVPNDTARHVEPTMPVLDDPCGGKHGALYVIVRELEAAS